MPNVEEDLRRLVIKTFHITEVIQDERNDIPSPEMLTVNPECAKEFLRQEPLIDSIGIHIIPPGAHDRLTNTIMDIIPISTKVLGELGEGITHTLTGVYVMLTGADTEGKQTHEFGSSEGNLKERLYLGRAGTPSDDDYIISFDVILKAGMGQERPGPLAAHRACDKFVGIYRERLKKLKGDLCAERHEYHDIVRPGKKKVLIIKQVAGQGAMYDTWLFPKEPSGVEGGRSIIDMGNMPVLLTPNEYRDGILRAMQ
ncbi:proline reductase cluster protein PrdD [Luxibacter massiliensis]|uniref:proline reductase cluster protein PrdD n=1 Tax=Luxibacter massiliensis TaxID=2219695 RepID=UPI000F070279|nr:proline reductase cluster protein PrdD [Luxibacter massiliensis]